MITIKESMLIKKCINDYVLENKLDYNKSPLFMDLMIKLKEFEKPRLHRKDIKEERKALKSELKKYSIQATCNKKILELMQSERIELIQDNKVIK